MNSMNAIEHNIIEALQNFEEDPPREAAIKFLNTLGYHSTRISTETRDRRLRETLESEVEASGILSDQRAISDWQAFHILFQITDDEANSQRTIFESTEMDLDLMDSYVFAVLELPGDTYSRTQLANITRFINKKIEQPIMVIFRYGDVLSLGIINRRWNQRDSSKQVLEQVTLIKDIRLKNPHAAHRRILADLWLEKLAETQGVRNFETLHTAWANVLDTEPLNKQFYSDLYKWYQWAVTECRFPDDNKELQVIRMITRLLFIWFLKEKNLVPDTLFEAKGAQAYLNDFEMENSNYYQAVLQNLFFATLNTPINERGFSLTDTTPYRFAHLLESPDAFLNDLKAVPFVNGGLFDCLGTSDGFTDDQDQREDIHVPSKLFFDTNDGIFEIFNRYKFTVEENTPVEQEVALDPELLGQVFENLLGAYNPETQTTARRATGSYYTPRQIVDYMIDESLVSYFLQQVEPYDNDKDFFEDRLREDLLAYDQLGEIDKPNDHLIEEKEVEPMINAINKLKIIDPAVGSGAFPMGILNKLVLVLQKLDPQNEYWKHQQIEQAKRILDPESQRRALNGIEEVFSEANSYNDYSRKLYLIQNCIYGVDIQPIAITIAKLRFFISLIVEQVPNDNRDKNYGIRPLPNLETKLVAANTLIGLKQELQLFLHIDNIEPLTGELHALQANHFSLTTLEGKQEHINRWETCHKLLTEALIAQLEGWRRDQQNRIAEMVAQLPQAGARQQLQRRLQSEYEANEEKLVNETDRFIQWKPYDQNSVAGFFEAEYMFGVTDGFDIAIGNPPYVRHEKILYLKPALREQFGDFFTSTADISVYFYKRAAELLRDGGILTYISTNKFMRGGYGRNLRRFLTTDMTPKIILDFGGVSVFDAAVDTCILLVEKYLLDADHTMQAVTLIIESRDFNVSESFQEQAFSQQVSQLSEEGWTLERPDTLTLLEKIQIAGNTLSEYVAGRLYRGIVTGCNDAFIINADTREWLIDEDGGSDELIKPLFRGRDISQWKTDSTDFYIIAIASSANKEWPWSDASDEWEAEQIFSEYYPVIFEHLNSYRERLIQRDDQGKFYWELRSCSYYAEFDEPKIVYPDISPSMRACYDTTKALCLQTAYILPTHDFSLLAILNSRLFDWYAKYKFQSLNDPWSGGGLRFIAQYMRAVPIADKTSEQQTELSRLVEQILENPNSNEVPGLEKEIDALVYQLYELSETEIALIEQTYRDAGMPV